MSPVSFCLSFVTSVTTSPLRTVELFHSGCSRGEDTTYLGRLFNLSAPSPARDDHRVANHWSLRRPSRRASVPNASSNRTLAHSSRSLPPNWPNHTSRLKPSPPSGSWTIPSSEAFVLIPILPISVLLVVGAVSFHWCRHRDIGKLGAHQPPSSPLVRCLYEDGGAAC